MAEPAERMVRRWWRSEGQALARLSILIDLKAL